MKRASFASLAYEGKKKKTRREKFLEEMDRQREETVTKKEFNELKEIVREVEAATIRARLREHGYHRAATARSLGMTRESLWAKLRQLGFVLPRRGE